MQFKRSDREQKWKIPISGRENLDQYMIQWKFIFDAFLSSNENLSHL